MPRAVCFLVALGLLAPGCEDVENQILLWTTDIDAEVARIEQVVGVDIKYRSNEVRLPYHWGIMAQATLRPMDEVEVARTLAPLEQALRRYPSGPLRKILNSIYLCSAIEVLGGHPSGLALDDSVYLRNNRNSRGRTAGFFRSTVHHELSSLFMKGNGFRTEAWAQLNPPTFQYLTDRMEMARAVGRTYTKRETHAFNEQGFVHGYGTSTLENDFNTYAELAFEEPERLQRLMREHLAIQQKYEVFYKFYVSIDAAFAQILPEP